MDIGNEHDKTEKLFGYECIVIIVPFAMNSSAEW